MLLEREREQTIARALGGADLGVVGHGGVVGAPESRTTVAQRRGDEMVTQRRRSVKFMDGVVLPIALGAYQIGSV